MPNFLSVKCYGPLNCWVWLVSLVLGASINYVDKHEGRRFLLKIWTQKCYFQSICIFPVILVFQLFYLGKIQFFFMVIGVWLEPIHLFLFFFSDCIEKCNILGWNGFAIFAMPIEKVVFLRKFIHAKIFWIVYVFWLNSLRSFITRSLLYSFNKFCFLHCFMTTTKLLAKKREKNNRRILL